MAEAKALSLIGFFAASVHPAHAHVGRPERYTADQSAYPGIKEQGLKTFHGHLKQIDGMLAGREWLGDRYSVLDPYGFVFYTWGVRRELPMARIEELHRVQGPHEEPAGGCARAGGRKDQGVTAARATRAAGVRAGSASPHRARSPSSDDVTSGLVFERQRDPGAERRDLAVLHRHVHLGDFGDAQVAQRRWPRFRPRACRHPPTTSC